MGGVAVRWLLIGRCWCIMDVTLVVCRCVGVVGIVGIVGMDMGMKMKIGGGRDGKWE